MTFIITQRQYPVIKTLRKYHITMLRKKQIYLCKDLLDRNITASPQQMIQVDKLIYPSDFLDILLKKDIGLNKRAEILEFFLMMGDSIDYDRAIPMVIEDDEVYEHLLAKLDTLFQPNQKAMMISKMLNETIIQGEMSKAFEISLKFQS